MSIKLLALDLYKAQRNVERLRKDLEVASPENQVVLKRELADARKEWEVLRKMLDGHKDSGSFRKKSAGFGS